MPNYTKDVVDFHIAMGLPMLELDEQTLQKNLQVRKRLIDEEFFCELVPNYIQYKLGKEELLPEVLDAIADSVYVLLGCTAVIQSANGEPVEEPGTIRYGFDGISYTICDLSYAYGHMENTDNPDVWEAFAPSNLVAARTMLRVAAQLIDLGTQLTSKFDLIWREVHQSNMAKSTGPKVNGKQMKPEGWKPPRIKEILEGVM